MSAYAWLAKLNISAETACRCGHNAQVHLHGKSCTAVIDESRMRYCKCESFREASGQIQNEVESMSKKKSGPKKSEGRKPVLAEFVKESFNIFASYKAKEITARVRGDGFIIFKDKEYASPNAAGMVATGRDHGIDGYRFWRFKKNGEEVFLDAIRGSKSLIKANAKPKKAAVKKVAKPKRAAKPRAPKLPVAEPLTAMAERQAAGA